MTSVAKHLYKRLDYQVFGKLPGDVRDLYEDVDAMPGLHAGRFWHFPEVEEYPDEFTDGMREMLMRHMERKEHATRK